MTGRAATILADPARRLSLLLWLVSFHSIAVGLGMIWQPPAVLSGLGYAPVGEPFFPVQGGVFHIVMAVGYALAARNLDGNRCLVKFTVLVKFMATVFLLVYWLFVARIPVVLGSGISDGIMAVLVGIGYLTWSRRAVKGGTE
jgi:hypothetical protein